MTSGHYSSLWPKATIIEMSQRGNFSLWSLQFVMAKGYLHCLVATVCYGQRSQQLRCQREAICSFWSLQSVMAKGHNNQYFTERLFVVFSHYSSLWLTITAIEISQRGYLQSPVWPKATTIEMSHRGYLWLLVATAPQDLFWNLIHTILQHVTYLTSLQQRSLQI